MARTKTTTLETLATQLAGGFAKHGKQLDTLTSLLRKHDDKLDALLEQTAHLTEEMTIVKAVVTTTSEHVVSDGSELRGIQREISEIHKRLDMFEPATAAVDELRVRIAAIEKHLGIDKMIAA